MFILRNARIITPGRVVERGFISIERGVVKDLGEGSPTILHASSEDLEGLIVIPGFIDTHTHGLEGYDLTSEPEPGTLEEISRRVVRYGVTSYTPTTVTASHETLLRACRSVGEFKSYWKPDIGARVLGVHLEGPYISPEMAGAQNTDFIRRPSVSEFREYWDVSRGSVTQITVAPEIEGAIDLIRYARDLGVTVSAGHTNASYEEGVRAVENGVSKATHFLNAMRRFHHRDPGVSLALLESERVFLELIVDMIHLHPAVVRFVVRSAGVDRIVLVTDSISATGLEDGLYELGGLRIRVERGVAKLADRDTLAGSTLTMIDAFKNIIKLGFSLREAVKMTSLNPAKSIGLESVGSIERGFKADLVVINERLEIERVYIEGEKVFER